jgi:hypothetical protein
MERTVDLWNRAVVDCMLTDIHTCVTNGAMAGAVLLTYCAIDAMSFLYMEGTGETNKPSDFRNWVDRYMKASPDQPYQYSGKDLWAARCKAIHAFGADPGRIIGYSIGKGAHSIHPEKSKRQIVLCAGTFINDFFDAADRFFKDVVTQPKLLSRVRQRIPWLFTLVHDPGPPDQGEPA